MKTMQVIREIEQVERMVRSNRRLGARVDRMMERAAVLTQQGRAFTFFAGQPHFTMYRFRAKGQLRRIEHGWTKDEIRAALGRGTEKNMGDVCHWIYIHGADVVNFLFIGGLLCRIVES